jgi:hypothetical protein
MYVGNGTYSFSLPRTLIYTLVTQRRARCAKAVLMIA